MQDPTIKLTPDERFEIYFPGVGDGHSIIIPSTEEGLSCLKHVLQTRQLMNGRTDIIGTDAAPVQTMMDDWLKDHDVSRHRGKYIELDLDFTDLDLEEL